MADCHIPHVFDTVQRIVEEWAGPVADYLAFCNADTWRKTASVRPALEFTGMKITAVGIRGSSPLPPSKSLLTKPMNPACFRGHRTKAQG